MQWATPVVPRPIADEGKRQQFLKHLAEVDLSQVVYLDEAGVNNTEDYAYGYCLPLTPSENCPEPEQ